MGTRSMGGRRSLLGVASTIGGGFLLGTAIVGAVTSDPARAQVPPGPAVTLSQAADLAGRRMRRVRA
jgi:hypothetical protein